MCARMPGKPQKIKFPNSVKYAIKHKITEGECGALEAGLEP